MAMTTLTSRQFNQDTSGAKRAADQGPVFITDRGRPSHVLMTMADYQQLTGTEAGIVERLAMAAAGEIDFDPPRAAPRLRAADLD